MGGAVRFGILGPVGAWGTLGRIELGGPRSQAVLAALLVNANRVVGLGSLVDAIWGEEPPPTAVDTMRTYVSRLRRAFAAAERGDRLVSEAGGYRIRVDPGELDLDVFDDHVALGREAVAAGRLAEAVVEFDSAMKLWRGSPFAGVPGPFARTNADALAETRLAVQEERLAVELELGNHADVIAELQRLRTSHPLRESLCEQLMVALDRSGRQAAALDVFRQTRELLVAELGVEPGTRLRQAHRRVLEQADPVPRLQDEATGDEVGAWSPRTAGLRGLPPAVADFTGRQAETSLITELCTPSADRTSPVVVAVDGMAGVGKTAFAVHVAHSLADRYPDAQVYIDLYGHTPGLQPRDAHDALHVLLRAVGVPAEAIPENTETRAMLWRDALAERRALVVLDNVGDGVRVESLLPAGPGCAVMITGRHRLLDLDGAHQLTLDPLSPADAGRLLTRIAAARGAESDRAAIAETVRLCGELPLAIRIAGARLSRSLPVTALRRRLSDQRDVVPRLRSGSRSVAAAFALSYGRLPPDSKRAFHLLGLHLGPDVDRFEAAALLGTSPDDAERHVESLVDASLIQQVNAERYQFHDLLRAYARDQGLASESQPDRKGAQSRVLEYYVNTMTAAYRRFFPGDRDGIRLATPKGLVRDFSGYEEFVDWSHVDQTSLSLASSTDTATHHGRVSLEDWVQLLRPGRPPTGQSGTVQPGQTRILHALGTLQYWTGRCEDAKRTLRHAMTQCRETGEHRRESAILHTLGEVLVAAGTPEDAVGVFRRCVESSRALGDTWGEAVALNSLGGAHRVLAEHEAALGCCTDALRLHRELRSSWGEGVTLTNLGRLYRCMGRPEEALAAFDEAVVSLRESGDQLELAAALVDLGYARRADDDPEQARNAWEEALPVLGILADPMADVVRGHLRELSPMSEPDRGQVRDRSGQQARPVFLPK
ncbi:afsR, regulatory protein [Amycolatopsis keratiniphila]|uniref:AfsR, regulatory protein n=1 Tax=Amycolatopsis keratiniphila TaxID=129921 RepID=R4T6H0_9PSEU|nr:afsR, regulatory protein [Amycolatopsis keratiniphila]